jgi:hypothetical protein
LDADFKEATVREMTSWKWSMRCQYEPKGTLISYLAALSQPGLDWSSLSFAGGPWTSQLTRRPGEEVEKSMYFAVRPATVKCRPCFRSLDRLPRYSEIVEGALDLAYPFDERYRLRARLLGEQEVKKA